MKKTVLTLCLVTLTLMAQTPDQGEAVFQAKCVQCHAKTPMMSPTQKQQMRQKMQNATDEEKQVLRATMQAKMKTMHAPAMPMVSMRLKKMLKDRERFIAFVEDYIQNPSQKKGYCMPMAYKRFGTMPPIGKAMSAQERHDVAAWLYDHYQGSWGEDKESKSCQQRNKQN